MAVDDMRFGRIQAKGAQDAAADGFIVDMAVVGIHRFMPGVRAVDERALEGFDAAAAQGRALATPEVPHKIHRFGITAKIRSAGHALVMVHQRPALIAFAVKRYLSEVAVLRHGNAAVKEQIAVVTAVQPSVVVEKAHMAAQPLAFGKGGGKIVEDRLFAGRQAIGIGGIKGGQLHAFERIGLSAQGKGFAVFQEAVQKPASLHAVFGMARDELAFQLEQKDGDGLKRSRFAHGTGVGLAGEQRQRAQADAVTGFQQLHVVVLQAAAHDGGHAHGVAGGRAHPQDIMVAPFDVHGVVIQQQIHDSVRMGAAIVDIAHDVQPVYRQALDQPA